MASTNNGVPPFGHGPGPTESYDNNNSKNPSEKQGRDALKRFTSDTTYKPDAQKAKDFLKSFRANSKADMSSTEYNKYRPSGGFSWTGQSSSFAIGYWLRDEAFEGYHYELDSNLERMIKDLDKQLETASAPRDFRVVRYIDDFNYFPSMFGSVPGIVDAMNEGRFEDMCDMISALRGEYIVKEKSFTCVSSNENDNHFNWKRRVKFTVDVPKGAKVLNANASGESEWIFPRNTSFMVKGCKYNAKDDVIEINYAYISSNPEDLETLKADRAEKKKTENRKTLSYSKDYMLVNQLSSNFRRTKDRHEANIEQQRKARGLPWVKRKVA